MGWEGDYKNTSHVRELVHTAYHNSMAIKKEAAGNQGLSTLTHFSSLQGQTVYFVKSKRIPQQAEIRFIAESAKLLFLNILCCFGFHEQLVKILYCSKALQKMAKLQNPQHFLESTSKY